MHKTLWKYCVVPNLVIQKKSTGCPKKNGILFSFEFLDMGGVFLRVKNNSRNFYEFMAMLRMENIFRYYKSKYLYI